MVVLAVKIIFWTGIGNDVMDGLGLMEGLINSVKPLYFVVASITAKVLISCQKPKYQSSTDTLRISLKRKTCDIIPIFDDIITFLWL